MTNPKNLQGTNTLAYLRLTENNKDKSFSRGPPDALRVVRVGQLQASGVHVVEGHECSGHPLEVLQAAIRS